MKFIIGEEVKLKRTKGEKVTIKELGVGHLADEAKGLSVKEGKREYASATISKSVKRDLDELDSLMNKYGNKFGDDFLREFNKLMDRMKAGSQPVGGKYADKEPEMRSQASMPDPKGYSKFGP